MLDRDQLETFAIVVEQQSFDRAANVLSITRGAVSQRIKALEESLSTVQGRRERPVAATHAGEVLPRHVCPRRPNFDPQGVNFRTWTPPMPNAQFMMARR
jgi:hypothetical protein